MLKNETRLIKRYSNRKHYDTEKSQYVTLQEIGNIVQEGFNVQIIENKTKTDITYKILQEVIFDKERKSKKDKDVTDLIKFIKSKKDIF